MLFFSKFLLKICVKWWYVLGKTFVLGSLMLVEDSNNATST